MAEDESILTNPPNQDVATHVRDYSAFVRLLKWGAVLSFITAIVVMIIISN